jgi:PAS domain-containing protein
MATVVMKADGEPEMTHTIDHQIELSSGSGWLPDELLSADGMPGAMYALFEGHPDMVVVTDDQGNIVGGNSRLLEVFGYSRSQLEGQPIVRLLPQEARTRHD